MDHSTGLYMQRRSGGDDGGGDKRELLRRVVKANVSLLMTRGNRTKHVAGD